MKPGASMRLEYPVVTLVASANRIVSACEDDAIGADSIANIILEDPAVAARILRIANSPFYGAAGLITQVSRAVVRLGTIAVRKLVIGMCASDALGCSTEPDSNHGILWRHSIASAVAAEAIATRIGFQPTEEAFLAGLLHDIGQLAIAKLAPKEFDSILTATSNGEYLLAAEQRILNTDHTKLGIRILTRWGLPTTLCSISAHHHDSWAPEKVPDHPLLNITMLADVYANLLGFGFDTPTTDLRYFDQLSATMLSNSSDERQILDTLTQRTDDVFKLFDNARNGSLSIATHQRQAIWLSSNTSDDRIGLLLLEQIGFDIRIVQQLEDRMPTTEGVIAFVALSDSEASESAANQIAAEHRIPVVLFDDSATQSLRRSYDPAQRIARIPRVFSVFDILWIEEQLRK